jgi:hypothetical protein
VKPERTPKILVIERRRDGFRPSMNMILGVMREAKRQGFRSDWDCCGVLDSGALLFGCLADDMKPTNLIAVNFSGEWNFYTEREYYALRLPGLDSGYNLCTQCGQPMKPGRHKPGEYEHAQGCPKAPKRRANG